MQGIVISPILTLAQPYLTEGDSSQKLCINTDSCVEFCTVSSGNLHGIFCAQIKVQYEIKRLSFKGIHGKGLWCLKTESSLTMYIVTWKLILILQNSAAENRYNKVKIGTVVYNPKLIKILSFNIEVWNMEIENLL